MTDDVLLRFWNRLSLVIPRDDLVAELRWVRTHVPDLIVEGDLTVMFAVRLTGEGPPGAGDLEDGQAGQGRPSALEQCPT